MEIERTRVQNAEPTDLQIQKPVQEVKTQKKSSEGIEVNNLSISKMSKTERNALPVSEQLLINSIEKANKAVTGVNTRFEFSIHEKTVNPGFGLAWKGCELYGNTYIRVVFRNGY